MEHSHYASNGQVAPRPRSDSGMQGEALTPTETRVRRENTSLALELRAIVAAQRAISREIKVGRLIETLLMFTVGLVGAERGLLFLARGPRHEIEAEAKTEGGSVRVILQPALPISPKFPESILRYVFRLEESIVLDNALVENQFSGDDYLNSERPRSIICLPLITRRELVGVLYLENILAPGAFARESLAALELLASQAAASLRTSALCVDLRYEIEERRKAEEELERFHRMFREVHADGHAQLMGGLTAALAHELNQPLGAVQSNAQAARRFLSTPTRDLAEAKAAIEDIIRDTSRAVDTVQNVRAIFQRDASAMSSVDLGELLHDVARIVSADAALQGITVRFEVPAAVPPVVGNRTQLIQALMNLVLNAFEAISENNDRVREVEVCARQREPGRVHVAVRDSGKGIDPETMPQLFDAFFTTKSKGMGMGLAIVHSIIENHRGRLWVTRNPDYGATMEFDLPVVSSEKIH